MLIEIFQYFGVKPTSNLRTNTAKLWLGLSSLTITSFFLSLGCAKQHPNSAHHHYHEESRCDGPQPGFKGRVIEHSTLKAYENRGNELKGVATPSMGSERLEVWSSSIAPGGSTPLHSHSSQEIFIILQGEGYVEIGEQRLPFRAPATIIAPANQPHRLFNTGSTPTKQIVVIEGCSTILSPEGQQLELPWRK